MNKTGEPTNNINIKNVNDPFFMEAVDQLYRVEKVKNPKILKNEFLILLIRKGLEYYENLNEIEAFVKSNPKCRIKEKNKK